MSTITNGSMKLIKSDITDIIHSTIGSDLPNNFDKIDKTVDEVNTRINNILTTPVDGVSAQEIIDARGDSPTLGTRLNSMQTQTDSLQEEVDSLSTTGIPKLVSFDYDIAATTDNQTVFTIPYEYLSIATDTVEVFVNGIAVPDNYYIVTEPVEVESEITLGFVTLTEAKPTGTIVKVRILKNVPNGDEGSVDGEVITVDSIPLNRINSGELNDFMTDTLSEINASLNALTNSKQDKIEDTGWLDLTVNTDDFNIRDGYNPQIRKIGKRVFFRGQVIRKVNTPFSTLFTVPTGFRSPVVCDFVYMTNKNINVQVSCSAEKFNISGAYLESNLITNYVSLAPISYLVD